MIEFIFNLQRFGDGGSSSGSSSGGGTGGSSSGGSNAKTDGDVAAAAVEVWVDDWKTYSTKVRSALATQAYSLAQVFTPTYYYATGIADTVSVSGKENNIIYGVDRLDTVKFVDQNLESFATFYNYTEYNNYVDLILDMSPQTGPDFGSVTRLYLADENFTPVLSFASGLNVVYSFDEKTWFGSDEIEVASNFWNNYISQSGKVDDDNKAILPSEIFGASRGINNYITNVDWQDSINFYDTAFTEMTFTQKTDKGLAMTFLNGTGALVQYDGDFSPTFYFNDGTTRIYNSKMGAWRTVEEAWADAAQYAAESSQSVVDTLAFNTNFNTVYDASQTYTDANGNEITPAYTAPLVASRLTNTAIYNATLRNDVYFTDAVSANVVDVIHEDDSHFDIVFDTGAITRIEYADIVSPLLHFADGETLVFDNAITGQPASFNTDITAGFISASTGSRRPNTPAIDDSTVTTTTTTTTTTATQSQDNKTTDESNTGGNAIDNQTVTAREREDRAADSTDSAFEYLSEQFVVSRTADKFINKVTAYDDIYLVDSSFENISDFNITPNQDIILKFDTGKQLRVRDESIISPVFHFADGTSAAYNWIAAQWVGVTEAGDFNNGVTEGFAASAYGNNFFRNVEDLDYIYIPDATSANISDIAANDYYVNITFDTGANTAVRYTTANNQSPTFIFADGSTYRYNSEIESGYDFDANTQFFYGDEDFSTAETFSLSKTNSNMVYYTGAEDNVTFVDAVSTDVASIENLDAYTIKFTFNNGTTTIIDYWETSSPLFKFADGVNYRYDWSNETWLTSSAGEIQTYTGTSGVDSFILDKDNFNTVSNVRNDDIITFSNATAANIITTEVTADTVTYTFDNGATTTINYTSYYTPVIQFADGTGYQYYYSTYYEAGRSYNAYVGTDTADVFTLSKTTGNRVLNAGAADTIFIADAAASEVTYKYVSTSSYSPYIELDFGSNYTYIYYNPNEGLTPNIVFADGTTYKYNTYNPTSAADNIAISRFNDSIVYYANDDNVISVVDAGIANVAEWGTAYNANLTFDTSKTAIVGMSDAVSPLFLFADGESRAYANATQTWAVPVYATAAADNIPLSSANTNIVVNAATDDTITIADAARANISDINIDSYGTIGLTFDNGASTTVTYTGNVTPVIALTDDTIQYNVYNPTSDADIFDLSIANNNILYSYVDENDTVNFNDATISNVTKTEFDSIGWDVQFTFDTGKTTYVEFDKSSGTTPTFNFTDGSYRYVTSYSSEAVKDVWQKYDTVSGTWQTTSEPVLTVYTSADLAESADLWGDTVDDDLFVDGTLATSATLSDLVAAPVDSAAVSFGTESAFDINTAGGFVASSFTTNQSDKTA